MTGLKQGAKMREILFRGKGLWGGDFYYGDLFYASNAAMYHSPFIHYVGDRHVYHLVDEYSVEVSPETVGQFTGLMDKNGTKIFEGDIVKRRDYDVRYIFYGVCSFRHTKPNGYAHDLEGRGDWFEVIGNIHDNPELLEAWE
jgi:uncharacterized phage protein (TIGR01671 family)